MTNPIADPSPRYGYIYIARVLSGQRQGLALAVTTSAAGPWYRRAKNMPFAGFQAGYLDLWEERGEIPDDETAEDGITLGSKEELIEFINGVQVEWLEGEALDQAITLFRQY